MRTTHAVCSRSALALAALLTAASAAAQEFFVHDELDYWGDAAARRAAKKDERPTEKSAAKVDDKEFRWQDYEDPTSPSFWDDGGNYVPPKPLRVAAADPTPENVAKYLRWQRRKISAITAFQAELQRQINEETPLPTPPKAPEPMVEPASEIVADRAAQERLLEEDLEPIDWRKVEFVFFYSSTCPHCRASVETVHELEQRGAKVIPVQVDWKENPPLLPRSAPYTAEIAKEQPIEAVPTWIAAYRGDRFTMEGEVSVKSIEVTLKLAEKQKREKRVATTQ